MANTIVSARSKIAASLLLLSGFGTGCGPGESPPQRVSVSPSGAVSNAPRPPPEECVGAWCPCDTQTSLTLCNQVEVDVTTTVFGARGLYTSPSFLTNAPVGATALATNAVVDTPGEYTTRPGFERLARGLPGDVPIQAWTVFQGRIIAHTGTRLYREDPDAPDGWTMYPGVYYPPYPGQDTEGNDLFGKMRFFEAQQALYFTTLKGEYRLEQLEGRPVLSGVPQALTGTLALSSAGSPQALNQNFATAYRYVWGRRAANGRIMLGAPSGRISIVNESGGARDVEHVIPFPSDLDDSFFFQAYRADEVPSTTSAGDEMYLVHERSFSDMSVNVKATGMTRNSGTVTVTTLAPHGLVADQAITLTNKFSDQDDAVAFPVGIYLVQTVLSPTTFRYTSSGPDGASSGSAVFQTANSYTFVDGTPDALKADALYTNVNFNSQGIGASRYRPPLSNATVVFGDRSFYGNVELVERVTLNLLGVGGAQGINPGQGLRFIFSDGTVHVFTGSTSENFPMNFFKVYTTGTPAQNVADTTQSLVRVINNRRADGRLYAFYASSAADLPGQIILETRSPGEGAVTIEGVNGGNMWAPALTATQQLTAGNATRTTANVVTIFTPIVSTFGHGYSVGQTVELLPPPNPTDAINFPPGPKIITAVPTVDSFQYQEVGTPPLSTVTNFGSMQFKSMQAPVTTDDEAAPGGWLASDAGNPDSVPFTVPEIAGDRYKRLYRFLVLGNSLFMLKEDGLFRLTGSSPETFNVDHVDSTVRFVAPDTAVVIGGRAYALTTQGLMSWTEATRPEPASVPVENIFRDLVEAERELVERHAFAVNDDASRRAYFFLPDASNTEEPGASQVYVYHTLTDAWTKWEKRGATALIHPVDGKLYVAPPPAYFGAPTAAPPYKERRSGSDADYVDEDGGPITTTITHVENYAPSPHLEKQWIWTTWHFRDEAPSLVEVGFSTNYNPTPIYFPLTSEDSQEPGTVSTPPTMEHSRGRYLKVSIRHAQVGVPLRLLGYAVRSRHYESR